MKTEIKETEKIEGLEDKATAYAIIDAQIKGLKKQQEELKKLICNELESEYGHTGVSVRTNHGKIIQRVLSVRQDVDEEKLEKVLSSDLWEKVTIPKVSMELLMSAIKVGLIKPHEISDALTSNEIERLVVRNEK